MKAELQLRVPADPSLFHNHESMFVTRGSEQITAVLTDSMLRAVPGTPTGATELEQFVSLFVSQFSPEIHTS